MEHDRKMTDVTVRKARLRDTRQVWQIRNSASVRRNSTNSDFIPYAKHQVWFRKYLKSSNRFFVIVLITTSPKKIIGYCRYDLCSQRFNVSIAIDQKYQSRGYGSFVLDQSLKEMVKQKKSFIAKIKSANLSSLKLFRRHHFVVVKSDTNYLHLERSK